MKVAWNLPYGNCRRRRSANADGGAYMNPREPDRPGHPEGPGASTETFKKPLHSLRGRRLASGYINSRTKYRCGKFPWVSEGLLSGRFVVGPVNSDGAPSL